MSNEKQNISEKEENISVSKLEEDLTIESKPENTEKKPATNEEKETSKEKGSKKWLIAVGAILAVCIIVAAVFLLNPGDANGGVNSGGNNTSQNGSNGGNGSQGDSVGDPNCHHVSGDWTVAAEADCVTNGKEEQRCTLCGALIESRTIAAKGHEILTAPAQTPDCNSIGWDEYEYCTKCDYSTYEEKPMEHAIEDGVCTLCKCAVICTVEDLLSIKLDGRYVLGGNIDLGGASWNPIGDYVAPFTGYINGNGYEISNFRLTGYSTPYIFVYCSFISTNDGTIENLGIVDFVINAPEPYNEASAAAFVGDNNGTVKNCYAVGSMTAKTDRAGGFVYANNGTIEDCYANVSISFESCDAHAHFVGGFSGRNDGYIRNCHSYGDITAENYLSSSSFGGFVGRNDGLLYNCSAAGSIEVNSVGEEIDVGGLVGLCYGGYIANCYATGDVKAITYAEDIDAGGLIGEVSKYSVLVNSYATGNVYCECTKGYENRYACAGGLVGSFSQSEMDSCYASGDVTSFATGRTNSYSGGLIGSAGNYPIKNCYALGNVSASATNGTVNAGGLMGSSAKNTSKIVNCYYSNSQTYTLTKNEKVTNTPTSSVGTAKDISELKSGSFLCENILSFESEIWNFSGENPVLDYDYINNTVVEISTLDQLLNLQGKFLTLNYKLTGSIDLGGAEWTPISVLASRFAGCGNKLYNFKIVGDNVEDEKNYVGFIGYNYGKIDYLSIENCTVQSVNSAKSNYVGGLVGYNNGGVISNCYSDCNIICTKSTSSGFKTSYVGGLIGASERATISNCYATGDVSSQANSQPEVGGLVGHLSNGTVECCYATGDIYSVSDSYISYAGGLVGTTEKGMILGSFATGGINATATASTTAYAKGGGLVGYCFYNDLVLGCYRFKAQTYVLTANGRTKTSASNSYGHIKDYYELRTAIIIQYNLGFSIDHWIIVDGELPTLKSPSN